MIARGGRSSPRMPARYIQYLEVRKGGKGLQPPWFDVISQAFP
jgi:hypothetical protein